MDHGLKKGPRGASGLAPQGYLTVVGERLIVPCGRALPGFLDRRTGELEPYLTGWGGRVSLAKGCWYVAGIGQYFCHTGDLCELATRAHLEVDPANQKEIGQARDIILTQDVMYYSRPVHKSLRESYRPVVAGFDRIVACDITNPTVRLRQDKRREDWKRATLRELWRLDCGLEVHIKAGGRLYAGAPGTVAAVEIPPKGGRPEVSWQAEIQGTPARMLAADGKLFVVTQEGAIHCFGPERITPRRHELPKGEAASVGEAWARQAGEILQQTTVHRIAKSLPGMPTVPVQWKGKPAEVEWPTTWQAFGPFPKDSTLLPGAALETIPEKLTLDGNDYPRRPLPTVEATLDFTCLYGGYGLKPLAPGEKPAVFPRPKMRSDNATRLKIAYALAEIDCPAAGRLTIGAAASGPMTWYLDGKCIYDPNSNKDVWRYYGFSGRLFSADVSGGRHVVAVAVRAGLGGWNLTSEAGAAREARFRAAMAGISHADVVEGYCLVWGVGSGRLAEELARQSNLHIIVVDGDAEKVGAFRRRLEAAGLYGSRVAVHAGDPLTFGFPPYLADLITSEDLSVLCAGREAEPGGGDADRMEALAAKVAYCLRPCGGVACLPVPAGQQDAFVRHVQGAAPAGVEVRRTGDRVLIRRSGALAGSTDWTHERADAANSLNSRDCLVKVPLQVLWFGGSVDRLFPSWDFTHSGHPIPLVAEGRVFMQVGWTLSAADAYTGRLLWKVALPAPERAYHSYAVAADGVHVVCGGNLRRLDAATGRTLAEIEPPPGTAGPWRQVRIWRDLLIGHVGRHVLAMDRGSGEALWSFKCDHELADLAVGGGRAFLIDCPAPTKLYRPTSQARLVALDVRKGQVLWQVPATVWVGPRSRPRIAYSDLDNLLVLQHRDVQAFGAADGQPLWRHEAKQAVPYVLHRSAIVNARTGELFDPLTGRKRPSPLWTEKLRGCSYAVASEYLLTVRDGHASYFDLPSCRREFLRGLRSGCTPSLIPANGLLNIPNFARGCSCNYSIFTSVALVPAAGQ